MARDRIKKTERRGPRSGHFIAAATSSHLHGQQPLFSPHLGPGEGQDSSWHTARESSNATGMASKAPAKRQVTGGQPQASGLSRARGMRDSGPLDIEEQDPGGIDQDSKHRPLIHNTSEEPVSGLDTGPGELRILFLCETS